MSRGRWLLLVVVIVLVAISLQLRSGWDVTERRSAILFVGLPAVMAIAVSFMPRAKSATGMAVKATSILLLLAGIVAGEGFICILMAAPIFYLVAVVVGWLIDSDRRRRERRRRNRTPFGPRRDRLYSAGIIPLLLMSLEGTTPALSFPAEMTASRTALVAATPAEVEGKLATAPDFSRRLSAFLALGFPAPVAASGAGLEPGSTRVIDYRGGGRLVLVVTERGPGHVRFRPVEDGSPISQWLAWTDSEVRWSAAGHGQTRVTWTLRFTRRLAPAWYFGPLETFGAAETAGYLIGALATP